MIFASGRFLTTGSPNRTRELEQMVPIRRPSIYYRGIGHGAGNGARSRLPIFWPRATEICPLNDVGMYGRWIRYDIPVVLLGVLVGVLADWAERIHWRFKTFWIDEYIGKPKSWITSDSRLAICILSGL